MKIKILFLLSILYSCTGNTQVKFKAVPVDSNYALISSMDSLSIVSGASKSGSTFTITGASNMASRVEYPRRISPAYFTETITVTPISFDGGRLSFGIGCNDIDHGSVIIVNDTGYVEIAKWSGISVHATSYFTFKSGINITAGIPYTIEINKRKGFLDFKLTHNGQSYSNSIFTFYDRAGSFMGNPSIIAEKGVVNVTLWNYKRPSTNPQFAVIGDSFIGDGDSLPAKKYVGLMEDSLGKENLYIGGKGGENTSSYIALRMNTELGWFQGQKTILIALGTNDLNFSTYVNNMNTIINAVKAKGCTPILVTITPRTSPDNSAFIAQANPWVKSSGYKYVDIHKAVTTAGAWKAGFTDDGTHPTDIGYQAIWEAIRNEIGTELKK